jgi:hypothetical protein
MSNELSNATWSVTGVLSDFIEDSRRAEMHIAVEEGIVVLFLRVDRSGSTDAVLQAARELTGQRVVAAGAIAPHADSKLRSPYFLSPSTLAAA